MAISSVLSSRFLRDRRTRRGVIQAFVVAVVIAIVGFMTYNASVNLDNLGVEPGFSFLSQRAGFDIPFSLIEYDISTATHSDAFVVGLLNTLLVSACSIILATIIGVLVGVFRLSHSLLIVKLATVYIEVIRNIPLLLHLMFWYFSIWLAMPPLRQGANFSAINVFDLDLVFLHNRGINIPTPIYEPGAWIVGMGFLVALVAIVILRRWSKSRHKKTGKNFAFWRASLCLVVVLPLIASAVTQFSISWDTPEMGRFNMQGGAELPGSMFALIVALSLYASAFIAENVRSGIQSIPKGQVEAAKSLGLKPGLIMSKIMLPQALRVIIPPVTNHYLNLVKNSSLAMAIGFPEVVNVFVGSSLNLTGNVLEIILMTMILYMVVSLFISLAMNLYNKKVSLKER